MEKAGYIKVKELSKGVESITEMKKDHTEWVKKEHNGVKMAQNLFQYSVRFELVKGEVTNLWCTRKLTDGGSSNMLGPLELCYQILYEWKIN